MPFFAGDLRTGEVLIPNIPANSGNAVVTVNAAGTITCQLKLPMVDPYRPNLLYPFTSTILPGKSFLGYKEDIVDDLGASSSKVINAGPIWSDSFDWDSKVLTINAAGLRSIFDYRFVLPLLVDGTPSDLPGATPITYSTSLRTIAKELVADAIANTGGELPIDFEADVAGSATRSYTPNEFHRVNEKLQQISGVIGGPDVAFRPVLSASGKYLRWNMVTGDPELKQSGADHAWDTTVPAPSIRGAVTARTAQSLLTAAYGLGGTPEGETVAIEAKSTDATLTTAGYPRLEDAMTADSITTLSVLQDHLDEATNAGTALMQQWTFSAKKDGLPSITTFNEGDYATIRVEDNPVVPDGSPRVRILSYTATHGDQFAKISCAPERV